MPSATPSTPTAASETAGRLSAYRALYAELRAAEDELADVVAHARERAREADLLRFGLAEIEAVAPQPGEDTSLADEEQRLGHADTLRSAAESAREALSSDEGNPDALAAVSAARTLLDGVRDHDPAAGELADRIAEVTYLLSDVAADVASYADGLDTDPARLASVSERRAALTALTRKYGETAGEVLAWAEASAARLAELDDTDDRVARLRERCERPARPAGPGRGVPVGGAHQLGRRPGRAAHRRARVARDAPCRARGGRAADARGGRPAGGRSQGAARLVGCRRGRVPARREHRLGAETARARAPPGASCPG